MMEVKTTKISCSACETPVAELKDGVLIIRVKHWGQQHETKIVVAGLDNHKVLVVV